MLTSLRYTTGTAGVSNEGKLLSPMDTYPATPLGVEPALGTSSHVAVLYINGPEIHVALLVRNKVAHVAHTAYLS